MPPAVNTAPSPTPMHILKKIIVARANRPQVLAMEPGDDRAKRDRSYEVGDDYGWDEYTEHSHLRFKSAALHQAAVCRMGCIR